MVLYDDTMHFPQNKETTSNAKNTYGEHDSSLSSIASATAGQANNKGPNRPLYNSYADYDVPPNKSAGSPMMNGNEGGSSSGHQSAGSSSDLDKRSGQSVSTNDSGVGVVITEASAPQQRSRPSGQQYQKQR